MSRRRLATIATIVAVASFALAGCAPSVPTETMSVINGNDILTADLGSDVTARGVVLAAILLVSGDIDKALSQGVVSAGEVAAAQKAIDEGTLDMWRQRAEADEATP